MFSKILIKLIDEAIFPAILLVGVRVLSIFLISKYVGIEFKLGPEGFVYPSIEEYIFVNSYTTVMMIGLLSFGLSFIILKSLAFHQTHITPHLTAKLFSLKMSSFIQTSYDLYSQGAIWLSYLYFITASAGMMALFGLMYTWVFWIGLAVSLLTTVLFVLDIENELSVNKHPVNNLEEVIVNFGELDE